MKNKFLLFLYLTIVYFVSVNIVGAQSSTNHLSIAINVLENGDVDVEEKIFVPSFNSKDIYTVGLGNQKPKNFIINTKSGEMSRNNYSLDKKNGFYYLSIKPESQSGNVTIKYKIPNLVHLEENLETLRFSPIIAESKISSAMITISLPVELNPSVIEANIYSSQSTTITDSNIVSGKKINLHISNLSNKNDATILVRWPKGTLNLSYLKKLLGNQNKTKLIFSITFGFLIPVGALITMLVLIQRSKKRSKINSPREIISYPPDKLTPMEVGILFKKKIYTKEIVATIISFASRGYLVISDHGDEIILAKKSIPDWKMTIWEKDFYNQIFSQEIQKMSKKQMEQRAASTLTSPEVVKLFDDVYREITAKGFFLENPHLVRMRVKVYGLIFYFFSIVMMLWTIITNRSVFYLFPIIGLLTVAYIIIKYTYLIPCHSEIGNLERERWLCFYNWLISEEPISYEQTSRGLFHAMLPYAIIFNCTEQWKNRFRNETIPIPDWYITILPEDVTTFDKRIIPVIAQISEKLSSLHGPTISY